VLPTATDTSFLGVDTWLWVNRLNLHVVKKLDAYAEYRLLSVSLGPDRREGMLAGLSWHFGRFLQAGGGYNFTDFNDDLTHQSYRARGPFMEVVGKW
jgi:hypothetical protein